MQHNKLSKKIIIFLILFIGLVTSVSCFVFANNKQQVKVKTNIAVAQEKNDYRYLIEVDGKYGYINQKGEVVIKPQFEDAKDFSEGLAAVKINEKWGYIDKTGKIIIKSQFEDAYDFSEKLVAVQLEDKWGYIDKQGKFIIEPKFPKWEFDDYARIRNFSEGLAAANISIPTNDGYAIDEWGYINKSGQFIIEPKYFTANQFKNGLASVLEKKYNEDYSIAFAKTCLFIDKQGAVVFEPEKLGFINRLENTCLSYEEGMLPVYSNKHKGYGYLNETNRAFIPTSVSQPNDDSYFPVPNFSEGYAFFKKENKMGYIDKMGHVAIKPKFDAAKPFVEGLAGVCINNKCGFIDKSGKGVIQFQFDEINDFNNGLAYVRANNKSGYINKDDRFVWYKNSNKGFR